MTLLSDLIKIKGKPVEETKVEYSDVTSGEGVELALARKHIAAAMKKGYPKQASINYAKSHLKGQGWSESHCAKVVTQAWKDLNDTPITEAVTDPAEVADDLQEMLDQMKEIMDNVKRLLRSASNDVRQHAEHYWLAHITTALGSDHTYMGGTSKYDTMEATIQKLRDEATNEGE
jgi:hypothetical protein